LLRVVNILAQQHGDARCGDDQPAACAHESIIPFTAPGSATRSGREQRPTV
jgi:hypothetical protein